MAVRRTAGHGESVALGRNDGAAFEHATQTLDVCRGPIGQIAEHALPNLATLAVAFVQQDGGRRIPVRDGSDIHGRWWAYLDGQYNSKILD